jgi:hypothetical protein
LLLAGVAGLEGASNTPLLTPKQRLSLCANAHTAQGPLNCTTSALSKAGSGAKGNNAAVSTGTCIIDHFPFLLVFATRFSKE